MKCTQCGKRIWIGKYISTTKYIGMPDIFGIGIANEAKHVECPK